MFKKEKLLVSFALLIVLSFFVMSVSSMALNLENSSLELENITLDQSEKKIICNATIDDDFREDSVIITLKKDANPDLKTLTKSDFPEVEAVEIINVTESIEPLVKAARQISDDEAELMVTSNFDLAYKNNCADILERLDTTYTVEELKQIEKDFNQMIEIKLKKPGKQNVLNAIKELEKREDVLIAQPNYIYYTCTSETNSSDSTEQWAINAIDLDKAWNIATEENEVLVGILDTGIDSDHTDLAANLNTSLAKDFVGEDITTSDPYNHGTGVAGIIGAIRNNGFGIDGVCQNVKMVNLRVNDENATGDTGRYAAAITYAKCKDIPILNMSIRNPSNDLDGTDAGLEGIIENYPGLIVCSAGNLFPADPQELGNKDIYPQYPGSYDCDNIITVAASNVDDILWVQSCYGNTSVDLAAPGEGVIFTTPDNQTYTDSGTSLAAPYVTGVAALLLSEYPNLTTAQLKYIILNSVDKVSSLEGKCVTGGRLNAYSALRYADKYYTIKYDANGGNGVMADTRVYYNNATKIKENKYVRDGYDFAGWYVQRESDKKWRYESADGTSRGWYVEGSQPTGWKKYMYQDGCTVSATSSVSKDTVTFYAQWKMYYTIRYFAYDGGIGDNMPDEKAYYGTVTQLSQSTYHKTNHVFAGWHACRLSDFKWYYENADSTSSGWYDEEEQPNGWKKRLYQNKGEVYISSGDINETIGFYAQWTPYFYVSYNANGGSGHMQSTTVVYGKSTETTSNTFTCFGNEFDCWFAHRASDDKWRYTNADGTQKGWYLEGSEPEGWTKYRYENGCSVYATSSVAGDTVTFYAQWKKRFVIQYNANGGEGTMGVTQVTYGVDTPTMTNAFTHESGDFDCWYAFSPSDSKWHYASADGTQKGWYEEGEQPQGWTKYRYENGCSVSDIISGTGKIVVFYAQWKHYYTIEYYANGGSGTMADTRGYEGETAQTSSNAFTYTGCVFDGWNVQRASDGKYLYINDARTESGWYTIDEQPDYWTLCQYDNGAILPANICQVGDILILRAKWKVPYTITYNNNDAHGIMDSTTAYSGTPVQISQNIFSKEGYDFDYWTAKRLSDNRWLYTNGNGEYNWYTSSERPSGWSLCHLEDGQEISLDFDTTGVTITLYAQWEEYFTIVYDANGGEGVMESTKGHYGEPIEISSNTFYYMGKDFAGWYTLRAFSGEYHYISPDGAQQGWYHEGSQPAGWVKRQYYYGDVFYVASGSAGEIFVFSAQWS